MKAPPCGVCKGKTMRVQIPPEEMGPYMSFIDGNKAIQILGKEGKVPVHILQKLERLKIQITLVVPVMFACVDKCYSPTDEDVTSYMTFWMRKDGKEGFLFRETKERQKGHGRPLLTEIPGNLRDIQG